MNEIPDIKRRQYRDSLMTSGTGVILFGIWSVTRTLLTLFLVSRPEIPIPADSGPMVRIVAVLFFASIYIAVSGIYLSLRLYIGLSARQEAKGVRKSGAYLVAAGILALFLSVTILYNAYAFFVRRQLDTDTAAVTLLLDITSLFALLDMIISAVLFRRSVKQESVTEEWTAEEEE